MSAFHACRRQLRHAQLEQIMHAVDGLLRRARRWMWRYVPAEIAALLAAVVGATIAAMFTNSDFMLVASSVYGGSAGYYGALLLRELIHQQHDRRVEKMWNMQHAVCPAVRGLVLEFGGAEVLDSLLFSPVLLYISIRLIANLQLAVVLSEIAGSIAFYSTVFIARLVRMAAAQRRNARHTNDRGIPVWHHKPYMFRVDGIEQRIHR